MFAVFRKMKDHTVQGLEDSQIGVLLTNWVKFSNLFFGLSLSGFGVLGIGVFGWFSGLVNVELVNVMVSFGLAFAIVFAVSSVFIYRNSGVLLDEQLRRDKTFWEHLKE